MFQFDPSDLILLLSDDDLLEWGTQIKQLQMDKSTIGWNIQSLEEITRQARERESDSDDE